LFYKKDGDFNLYELWEELEKNCSKCVKCELFETRSNVVFGVGNKKAEVMFVGEGPGENEDLRGEPFVGKAGRLLDEMLAEINFYRDKNIYIANIVKCRPPKNRDPSSEEQLACIDWLRNQTLLIKPKILVCLGRIAAQRIIKDDLKITKEHGLFYKKGDIFFMPTFHPAAILRDPSRKKDTLKDFLNLKKKLKELTVIN
jgi:DNA polymerase